MGFCLLERKSWLYLLQKVGEGQKYRERERDMERDRHRGRARDRREGKETGGDKGGFSEWMTRLHSEGSVGLQALPVCPSALSPLPL